MGFIGDREELAAAKEASRRVGFLQQPLQQASTVDDGCESDENTKDPKDNWV